MDAPDASREIDILPAVDRTGTLPNLFEGSYLAVIDLYNGTDNKAAVWTRAVHIYGGVATSLDPAFTSADFAACPSVITGTTLAAKLDAALASPSGSYTIVLNGTESDLAAFAPKTLNVTENKNIAITIRGNGREVQVNTTGTPLFTLGAASGSSLSLTVQELTLRGRSGNSVPVVQVNDRGTLLMKVGSLITGNVFYSNGGGVYVSSGGTVTMNGGAVSDNTTGNGGGGVYVGGTFNMNGGAISGNTAEIGGGGVAVYNGTFNMNGGMIINNSADSLGGGVYVGGTFNMNGGTISSNTTENGGGGVYVNVSKTFTMSGGMIINNSTDSYGGGVYLDYGTFNMNGGAISSNTAENGGGGVSVDGTFTMSGGAVNGNTSSYGGGVYLAHGTFTKQSGGVICGSNESNSSLRNTATSGYGHAVYVSSARRRNTTAGMGVTLDSTKSGAEGGWE
jgi:hypothetical protein